MRDDDTSYFTSPEELARVYGDVWDQIPVCLATVPFTVGYRRIGIPEQYWDSRAQFALERNDSLVSALRELIERRRATIALHGYTHEDYADGFEFQSAPDPGRRVAAGLRYLASVVPGPIQIFVPPHNALSRRGLAAVSGAGLNILGSFLSFRPSMRPWDLRTPGNWMRVRRFRGRTGRTRADRFVYPFVLRYDRHAEFGCHTLVPGTTFEELVTGFDEARLLGGDFCLATHHWEVSAGMKDLLRRFLDYAARFDDVRFVAAEELFR